MSRRPPSRVAVRVCTDRWHESCAAGHIICSATPHAADDPLPRGSDMSRTTISGTEICQELDRLAASGTPFDELLSRAVDLVHEAHPRFHWTGIYELFPDDTLRLGPFVG